MERNTQRINGIPTRLHRLSDDELEAHMGFAHGRIEAGEHDLEALGVESARRFSASEQPTEELPVQETRGQLRLVDFDYLSGLGHVAGNPFYTEPEPPTAA